MLLAAFGPKPTEVKSNQLKVRRRVRSCVDWALRQRLVALTAHYPRQSKLPKFLPCTLEYTEENEL